MKHWVSRLGLAALCTAIALPAGAVMEPFTFDPEKLPETVGTQRDPGEHQAAMSALQKGLTARHVARGLRSEAVVAVSAAERKSIDEPSSTGGKYQVGVNKALGATVSFAGAGNLGGRTRDLALGAMRGDGNGGFTWTAALRSPGATGLRAHITGLDLPEGAGLFVYNQKGQAFGPYTGRGPLGDGEVFTNTVFGEQLLLQLEAPGGASVPAFRVVELGVLGQRFLPPSYNPAGMFDAGNLAALGAAEKAFCSYNATCIVNAACQSSAAVNVAKDAVATMLFSSGGGQFICTGQLIADTVSTSVIPYFLTAHHCISTSGEAGSLETYFDYQTTCSSPNCTQPYNNTGETVGSTIKATGTSSDFSLLQLSSAPTTPDGVVTYLGWNTAAIANTTTQLYRVSHPKGAPQAYSEQRVDPTKPTCGTLPRGRFLYSKDNLGATEGGSSGSAVVNGAGEIVGQLYGACGTNLNNVCDANSNATVDGAFANTYPSVSAFLNPGGGGSCTPAGGSCSSGSQCCSGQCKGKPGSQTCK
ncbi:MAG TPA: serine protease [Thermoanaerobaculia bacterium]|nr:serine protease [Thermoanaerobaculia bacterium]